ncbi:OLC1v1005047C1 [Oldenlandia corymbosa var. corymbosa]|uniref:OLC1v1005047C1 n=1 Tax=Oldenlandia corymbosa var. corymbosa TaxID=529605 RepID=A0AAV1DG41_OLDCO|nr:OLC1v1005047C1 [Oldenlandia corymbosa var. corymbosa]
MNESEKNLRDSVIVNATKDDPTMIPLDEGSYKASNTNDKILNLKKGGDSMKKDGYDMMDILVKVHVEFRDIPQPFYYMACKECGTGTSAIYQQDFKCNKWSLKQSATNSKCRLRANIHDESGSIQASIFSSIAEKILGFTATEIVENPEKINLKEIHELLEKKNFLLQLRGSKRMYRGLRDYYVNNLIEDDSSFVTPLLITKSQMKYLRTTTLKFRRSNK